MNIEQHLGALVYVSINMFSELRIMSNTPELTAALLKQARAFAGWSQRELAKRAGLQESSVKYWESKTGVIGGVEVKLMLTVLTAELMSDEQAHDQIGSAVWRPDPKRHSLQMQGAPRQAAVQVSRWHVDWTQDS
jgi:DNA-binding transcriptional regulator YiaG